MVAFTRYGFLAPGHPLLKTTAGLIDIEEFDTEALKNMVSSLREVFEKVRREYSPDLVGIAAPQIGISKSVILVDLKGQERSLRVFFNPKIIWNSLEGHVYKECCPSVNPIESIPIVRACQIDLQALDENGLVFEERFTGNQAGAIQHLVDHLHGTLLSDRVQ